MLVLLAALSLPRPSRAASRDLEQIDNDLSAVAVKLRALTDRDLADATARGVRSFGARLNDAEVMFILGDFGRAALILYEAVREPRSAEQPDYDKALHYLAESFFQLQNDRLANTYFGEILKRPNSAFRTDAGQRIIEIGDRIQDWAALPGVIEAFRGSGGLPPVVAYAYGRSLLARGRVEDALHVAAGVPPDDPVALKAAYVQAVAKLEAGDVDGARDMFGQIAQNALDSNRVYDDAQQIHDLAALAMGRLMIEQGTYDNALQQYQKIEHTSGKFEDALYELTWLYVRAGQHSDDEDARFAAYNQAVDRLELLLLEPSNAGLVPDASLLMSNVSLNLGRYQAAEHGFSDVVTNYTPMRDTLDNVRRTNPDLAHVFLPGLQLKTGKKLSAIAPTESVLPPLANLYARDEEGLQRAVSITHDLDDSGTSLQEADALLQKIAGSLELQGQANFSYALQDTQNRALEVQNTLISMTEHLLAAERALVQPVLTPVDADKLQQLLAERAEIEPRYRALPQRQQDYENRDTRVRDGLSRLQGDAYRVKFAIEEQQQQLAALSTWYNEHPDLFSASASEQFKARLAQETATLHELETVRAALNTEIDTQRTMSGVMSTEQAQEEALRTRYAASLEAERELLEAHAGGVNDASRAQLDRIQRHRDTIGVYHAELENFRKSMTEAIHQEMQRSLVDVEALKQALASEHRDLEIIRTDASDAVSAVAGVAMKNVRDKFFDIVLRGDVGVVDVAWETKEEQTRMVNHQVSRQHDEMQQLDNEFKDVMTKD